MHHDACSDIDYSEFRARNVVFDAKLVRLLLANALRSVFGEIGASTGIDILHCNNDTYETVIRVPVKYVRSCELIAW